MVLTRNHHSRLLLILLVALLSGCNLVEMTPTSGADTATSPALIPTLTLPPLAEYPTQEIPTESAMLFLGDSITQGWRELQSLYPNAVNAGRAGDTSAQVLARYTQGYVGYRFDTTVLHVGINDITGSVGDVELRANVTQLADLLRSASGRVALGAILPVDGLRYNASVQRRIHENNAWLRELAAQQGFRFVDYYAVMADTGGNAIAAYFQDGLHPALNGYRVMAQVLADALG